MMEELKAYLRELLLNAYAEIKHGNCKYDAVPSVIRDIERKIAELEKDVEAD